MKKEKNKIFKARIISLVLVIIAVIIVYATYISSLSLWQHAGALTILMVLVWHTHDLFHDYDLIKTQHKTLQEKNALLSAKDDVLKKQRKLLHKGNDLIKNLETRLGTTTQALQRESASLFSLSQLLHWMALYPIKSHVNRQDLLDKITTMENMVDNITAALLQQDVHTYKNHGNITSQIMHEVMLPPQHMQVMWSNLVQNHPSNDQAYVATGIYMYVHARVVKRIERHAKDLTQHTEFASRQEYNQTIEKLRDDFKKHLMRIHVLKPHNN